MKQRTYIDRPPRIQPALPYGEHEIPRPQDVADQPYAWLLQIAIPVLTVIVFVMGAVLGGGLLGALLVIPMAASAWAALVTYNADKQKKLAAQQGYSDRLVELNREMHNYHDMQRRAYHYNYPDVETTHGLISNARFEVEKSDRTLRAEARLWERRSDDDDFGYVRLGIGTVPSTVTYKLGNVDNLESPQIREAMKLAEDSRFVDDVPVVISLRKPPPKDDTEEEETKSSAEEEQENAYRPPVTHALGIAGDRRSVYPFVRAMLGHYVTFHAALDTQLYVLASESAEWRWTESLPHCQVDEQADYHCYVNEIEQQESAFDDDDGGEFEQFLEGIRKLLAQRKIREQDHDNAEEQSDTTLPQVLLVVDLLDATYDASSLLHNIEGDAAISILLEDGARLGATVIFLVPERSKIPGGCVSVLEIEETAAATSSRVEAQRKLHFRYAEVGVNSSRYVGRADQVADVGTMEALAEELATLDVRQGFGANLAGAVPFLDLMGFSSLGDLRNKTWQKWQHSVKPSNANWLRVKLGLMSGNKPRTLVMSAKRDGVHGMVAGSTGSGKSELLISYIIGLAVTYDPTVLNFVLVDYKGGSAFNEFKGGLPHCVDVITNLGEDGVARMFTSIRAEMERRQRLNLDTSTKNIVDYRQKGFHESHAPYPYLFIIIDEFAEMIAARAEYKNQLETITRLGRAQGVSLILAAQRPSGVTDQMRSNIKWRICLRVETPAESREMLRRSDAAFLPTGIPGRGYLQVGNDEIELMQVAYSGERYVDPGQAPSDAVIWLDRNPQAALLAQDQEPPELYVAIIDTLKKMSVQEGVAVQRAPWPDFLPRQLWLSQLLISSNPKAQTITSSEYLHDIDRITLGQPAEQALTLNPAINKWFTGGSGWIERLDWARFAMRPVVGLIDNPYEARQLPLVVDLPAGNALIVGVAGQGKTVFVRTLVASLAATHSPNHFQAYVLDLGGRNLKVLETLPHVGALIMPDEEGYQERVEQLLRELNDIVDHRKGLLNVHQANDIYEYNQKRPEAAEPAILMVIDNFLEFKETFGGDLTDDDTVLARFIALVRLSKPYGLHFVITANQLDAVPTQLYNLFTERFALRLADTLEYREILGESVPEIRDVPGRGYAKIAQYALMFQVATVSKPDNELQRLAQLVERMEAYAKHGNYRKPVRVDGLAKSVLYKHMLAAKDNLPLDEQFLPAIMAVTKRKWAESRDAKHADWLKVMLGLRSGDHPRTLELEAKKDGVHGLIAGGTGAGKSELLMTMIVGLALNYDPSILNFLLVDYKGGGAFQPFADLPHCVGMITNLNKSAVNRVFTTINAEMQRRQKLNAETGTANIVEYREKNLHITHAPYPHLFIVIDEFAEMITDAPEFRNELDSITRVGRSAGVNLILAAQRPIGVSDQMRANIKLRICLRVEGIDTSREMLRRPDAAFLPNGMPGRGYIQVGNENIELVQAAYTGEPYQYVETPPGIDKPKFYTVMVDMANELLEGPRPLAPWPAPLPAMLPFTEPQSGRYIDAESRALFTLGQTDRLAVNPFVGDWLAGSGAWPGLDWDATAMRAVAGIIDDPHSAKTLPLEIDFSRGHAVMFGAAGWGKTSFLRSLIVSLAATHSPDEFQAHVLDLGNSLDQVAPLPHVGTIIKPDERGYEERVQQLWRELNDVVNRRRQLFNEAGVNTLYEYNKGRPARLEPAILVAIDNFAEYIETFGKLEKEDDPNNLLQAFVSLARQGISVGIHFAITISRLNLLNSKLYSLFTERLTLRLADNGDYSGIVGSSIPDIDEINGRGYVQVGKFPLAFQVALLPPVAGADGLPLSEKRRIMLMAENMQAAMARSGHEYLVPLRIGALPDRSSYRQVLAKQFAITSDAHTFERELKGAMRKVWDRNASAEHAGWLYTPMGIASGNRIRTLQLEAKRDGVHGLIAGGTGSGKSELLMTMIVGLAVNFSPDILNFILVDYKGGGAFKPFADLPHVVDIVTNLNKAGVNRMFTAINAEIRRRQGLNADTNTKDIVEYRQKGMHLTGVAYPHLFIIIDEYSEMIDDNPDYRVQLDSITRVGRAQGVNLILASQQPKGVSDQMRANIKMRLCLRVEQADTSRELLRAPDAALLPNGMPGRGYMQIGNENLELLQISYAGEPQPPESGLVQWPDRPELEDLRASDETPRLFDAVVNLAAQLYGHTAPKPWPSFLPEHFSLETPIADAKGGGSFRIESAVTDWINAETEQLWPGVDWSGGDERPAMRPVIGLLDDPSEARQDPLSFELSRNHLVVLGDAGLGKSTLLRSVVTSLAATHSPDEFHCYVLDLGGRNLRSLAELPHTGAIIYADEEAFDERLVRLVRKLDMLMSERQRIMSTSDAKDFYDFNARFPERSMPAVLVLIDNFSELQENHEALVEMELLPLVRASLGAGITFAVTANTHNNLYSKLYALFSERVTFRQSDPDRYMDIVGRGAVEFGDTPGRGYIRRNGRPLLFHIAQPAGVIAPEGQRLGSEAEDIRRLATNMRAVLAARGGMRTRPDPISTLPALVGLGDMLKAAANESSRRVEAVLGQNDRLLPALFDLKRMGPHFAVAGPPLSGKTTTIYNWALSLAERNEPSRVNFVLIDTQRRTFDYGGAHTFEELPHVLAAVWEPGDMPAVLEQLKREATTLAEDPAKREIFVLIDNYDDFSEENEANHDLIRELSGLARRYGRDGLHFIIAGNLDGMVDDLAKRIKLSGYGLGLRTSGALENLNVHRVPPGLDQRELPVGRGYVVKAGQTALIQIATPYELGASDDEEEEGGNAPVLDRWVEELIAKYPEQKAQWSAVDEQPEGAKPATARSEQFERMVALLRKGMLHEIASLKANGGAPTNGDGAAAVDENGNPVAPDPDDSQFIFDGDGNMVEVASATNGHANGHDQLVLEQLLALEPDDWSDEETIRELLGKLWRNRQRAGGVPDSVTDILYTSMDLDSLLYSLESEYAEAEGEPEGSPPPAPVA